MSASANNLVLVGNPGSRRVDLFQAAVKNLGLPPARLVAYADLLTGRADLSREIPPDAIVKVDSPGKDFPVEKLILALGASQEPSAFASTSAAEIAAIPCRKGQILFPQQWFLGFAELIDHIGNQLANAPPHFLMNDLPSLVRMFDKPWCHEFLRMHQVPVPRAIATPLNPIRSHADLLERMAAARMPRVFLKLAHGSSASGVVAFQTSGNRQQITTTTEMQTDGHDLQLFNSRRIRTCTDPTEIRTLIDALCRHHVHVEEWIPKAGIAGKTFDLRILGIAGTPRHVVVRTSRHPITNLHLLNQRGDLDAVRARMGPQWDAVMKTCRRVMALFPKCLYVALDVLIRADWRAHAILELNAFGDLLPGLLDAGEDVYTAQIRAAINTVNSARMVPA
jgi:hypothetical protein